MIITLQIYKRVEIKINLSRRLNLTQIMVYYLWLSESIIIEF